MPQSKCDTWILLAATSASEQHSVQRPRPEQKNTQGASPVLEDLRAPPVADKEPGVKRLLRARAINMAKQLSAKGAVTQDLVPVNPVSC